LQAFAFKCNLYRYSMVNAAETLLELNVPFVVLTLWRG
jgi:hypothetical protein